MSANKTKIQILSLMTLTILLSVLPSVSLVQAGNPFNGAIFSRQPQRLGEKQVFSLALSPDGNTLASVHNQGTAPSTQYQAWAAHTIYLWDVRSRTLMGALQSDLNVVSVIFGPDGKTLASTHNLTGPERTISLWDVAEQTRIGVIQSPLNVSHLAFSPNGETLATSGRGDDMVRLWDVQTRSQIGALPKGEGSASRFLIFSPEGGLLTIGGRASEPTIRLLDLASQQQVGQLVEAGGGTNSLSFSPDGRVLACASFGGTTKSIWLWDFETRDLIGVLGQYADNVGSATFSPDGRLIGSTVYWDDTIHLWDVERQEELGTLIGHDASDVGWNDQVIFSPDGKWLASGSENGVEFWEIRPDVDFNDDGAVDIDDLSRLIESWGLDDPLVDIGPMPWGDGIVDAKDLAVLAEFMVEYASNVNVIQ
ncbi:MAG: hypothetical protein ACYTDV_10840 [Planctomycetota bacterium]|jgi:WD40 repeat protein